MAERAVRGDYPGAEPFLPKDRSIAALGRAAQHCEGCDLHRDATQAVLGRGATQPTLVLVGEQPGDVEDREGEPFVGPAGRMLDRALSDAGVDPATTYWTNAVKHFRFRGTRGKRRIHQSPAGWQVTACRPWLQAELSTLRPQGVVVLGAVAGRALLGSSFRVGSDRGRLLEDRSDVVGWVVATAHPSSVLRSPDRERDYAALVADLAVAAEALH